MVGNSAEIARLQWIRGIVVCQVCLRTPIEGSEVVQSKSGLVSMELLLRRILSYRSELESWLGDMERRMSARYFRSNIYSGCNTTVVLLLFTSSGKPEASANVKIMLT